MMDPAAAHPDIEQYLDTPAATLPDTVRAHLAGCAECEHELEMLTALRREARALPREVAPEVDLWPGIAARIGQMPARNARSRSLPTSGAVSFGGRAGATRGAWWLAAAAGVAVLIMGGNLLPELNESGTRASAAGAPAPSPTLVSGETVAPGLLAFASSEPEYRSTVESLEEELAARRDQLDPATVAVVERNLAIIDSAIAEARRALAADPSSVDLPLLLAGIYRQKLELLQQAVRVAARS